MNSTGGFWLTCLASLCSLFVYVSCRPISLDQDRIGTSEWAADYEADDDQTTLGSDVTRRFDRQDDVPNAKESSYNGPATGAPLSWRTRQRDDYYSPLSDQHCRYCDNEFDDELVDSVMSYGTMHVHTPSGLRDGRTAEKTAEDGLQRVDELGTTRRSSGKNVCVL